jgi:hypothetical protein
MGYIMRKEVFVFWPSFAASLSSFPSVMPKQAVPVFVELAEKLKPAVVNISPPRYRQTAAFRRQQAIHSVTTPSGFFREDLQGCAPGPLKQKEGLGFIIARFYLHQ